MSFKFWIVLFLFILPGWALAQPADAPVSGEPAPAATEPASSAQDGEEQPTASRQWHLTLTPVLWLASSKTDLTVGDRTRTLKLDAADALKNFEAGVVGRLEANNGQWGGFADLFYIRMADDATVGPLDNITLNLETENLIWQVAGTYRVVSEENLDLDLLLGARGYSIDVDLEIEPFSGPAGVLRFPGKLASRELSFVDPILGAKARVGLSDRWDLDLYGDVGGFGAGSDFTYRAGANLGYAASESLTLRAGYIVMSFDNTRGSGLDEVRYKSTMYGPVLGAGLRF